MYTIHSDGKLLHAPHLFDEGCGVFSPRLTVELNKAGSLEFTLPPNNILYDDISKLKPIVTVQQDSVEIFRGRVLHDEKDFYKQKKTYCEGELAFLLDSQQRPYKYEGDAKTVLTKYISAHNNRVDSNKRFTVGTVTVAPGETLYCENSEYGTTFDEINNYLISMYGGYLRTRTENDVHYIDWLAEATNKTTQTIEFGVNLLDLTEYITAEDIFTVIIPIGSSMQDEEGNDLGKLTISSVNDGKDYIVNETAASIFGLIEQKHEWSEIEDASELKTLGTNLLNNSVEMAVSLSVKAVDLTLLGVDVGQIRLGDMIRVISLPHGLDRDFQCTKIVYNLDSPDQNEYTFGVSFTSLTSQQATSQKNSKNSVALVQAAVTTATNSAKAANKASQDVQTVITNLPTEYVPRAEFEELEEKVENLEMSGGTAGENGATFTPSVSTAGVISWTNDKGLTNPSPVDIKGPAGPAGSTPVKGTDYWTATDKQEIVDDVLEALPNGDEVSY